MEKSIPIWIMCLLAMGVMMLMHHPIVRPLEVSFGPVDEANATFDMPEQSVSFTGFAARRLSSL